MSRVNNLTAPSLPQTTVTEIDSSTFSRPQANPFSAHDSHIRYLYMSHTVLYSVIYSKNFN